MTHDKFLLAALAVAFASGCAAQAPATKAPVETTTPAPPSAVASIVVPIPATMTLSAEAGDALQTLANAPAFGGEAVGYAGQPVEAVAALRLLLEQPDGADALELVLQHGTLPAQLLALSGMYYADHATFEARLAAYRHKSDSVPVYRGGCFMGFEQRPVSALLSAPGSMQIGPNESLQQWAKRNPGNKTLVYDIEGGGYPRALAGR